MVDLVVDPIEVAGRAYRRNVDRGGNNSYVDYLNVLFDIKIVEFYSTPQGGTAEAREVSAEGFLEEIHHAHNRVDGFVQGISGAWRSLIEQGSDDSVRVYESATIDLLHKARARLNSLDDLKHVLCETIWPSTGVCKVEDE